MPRRILITGGAGFIGSLTDALDGVGVHLVPGRSGARWRGWSAP